MKKILFVLQLIVFMSCGYRENVVDKNRLLGNDYRLFQGTPVWELAKAVDDGDVDEIKRIVKEDKVNIDYQEEIFGNTLLMLTVVNEDYKSCKTLLELGANPNIYDTYDGTSAVIDAAEINNITNDNTKFLKLLLEHGGDPNAVEVGERREGNNTRYTPLIAACSRTNEIVSPIEKVKVLIDYGADINYKNEFGGTALNSAYIMGHLDVVIYLLEKGADYNVPIFVREGVESFIWDELRVETYSLGSKKHKQKMAIVDFLKQKGIDYRKVPIPDYIVEKVKKTHPFSWEEYLKEY